MDAFTQRLPKEERAYLRRVLASWDDPETEDRTYRHLWGVERRVFLIAAEVVASRSQRLQPLIARCESTWLTTRKGSKVFVIVGTEKATNGALDRIFSQIAAYRRRQARVRAAPGFYLAEHIDALWEIQSGRCYFSGESLGQVFAAAEYQIDHLWPLASSTFRISFGTNWPTNLALVTKRVNRMKGATCADDFISRIRQTKAFVLRPTKERRDIDEQRHDRFREFMTRECSPDENDWLG